MYKSFSMDLAGRTLTVDVDRVAKQANGAAFMHYGDTVVLSTATASEKPRDGVDFFPLSVEYEEKLYAVGKIPGGFNKREGKASENAILTSRVIDRPMRPLFPKDYRNDVTINNLVMSVDPDCSPELTAMLGSAISVAISDIPFDGPCATTQVGMIDGEFVINPSGSQMAVSDLKLTVASTREKVIMIEAGANEIPEARMIEAIYKAHEVNQQIIAFIDKIVAECGKPKHEYTSCAIPEELFAAIKEIVPPDEMEEVMFAPEKQVREERVRNLKDMLCEKFADKEEWLPLIDEAVYQYEKKTVRKMILKDHKRPDGREITQIRPLAAEVDIIPRVHGSAMFTRGQTQICNVCTLAPLSDAQKIDGLNDQETSKRYMHHYNFPAYSVGETKVSRGPGRREIGHGALADADDSAVVADVLCKALGQNRPELLAVLRAAFGNAELIADALGNVTGTVVLAELIVKITDSAREAYKLIAAKLAEIELFFVLGRNNAGNGADTLNSLGKSDILKQLIKKLNIILNKLVKAVVAVLGNEFVYDINSALGYAVLFGRCLCRIVKAYYLAEYRQTVINGFVIGHGCLKELLKQYIEEDVSGK